jgi:hypothetical protein
MSELHGPFRPGSSATYNGRTQTLKGPPTKKRVDDWLREHENFCFCAACVATALSLPIAKVGAALVLLSSTGYCSRYRAPCSSCGKEKQIAVARRL